MTRYRGELLILSSTISWGLSYLFVKTALKSLGAFNLVALRFTIACMVTALVFNRQARKIGRSEVLYGGILGTLLFASSTLLAIGLKSTSISNAGFIIGSMVLFVAIMDAAAARKRPRIGLIAGVLLALAGIGVLTLRGELSINRGDLYCLGSTLVLAVHVMVAQKATRRADVIGASVMQFAATAIFAWIASLPTGAVVFFPEGGALLAVLVLGVFGTAAAFVCQVAGQRYISPTRTAFLFTLEPIFATLFAWLFLHEPVTWQVYVGGGLLLSGVYISEYGDR